MGIADYGIGPSGAYQYSTNSSLGSVDIVSLSARNASGYPWMSIQLNVNLRFSEGSRAFVYWVQDVADVDTSANTVFFVDNIYRPSIVSLGSVGLPTPLRCYAFKGLSLRIRRAIAIPEYVSPAVDSPTRTAIIPRLVSQERLAGALSLNIALFQTTLVAGPAVGGLVIARFGLPAAYAIDVATFAGAFIAIALLPPVPCNPKTGLK